MGSTLIEGLLLAGPAKGLCRGLRAAQPGAKTRLFHEPRKVDGVKAMLLEGPWFENRPAAWFLEKTEAWLTAAPEARVVLLSTALVYGRPYREPVMEVDPVRPQTLAGLRAAAAEERVLYAIRQEGREGAVVRLGEVAGAGVQPGSWLDLLQSTGEPMAWPENRPDASILCALTATRCVTRLLQALEPGMPRRTEIYHLAAEFRPVEMAIQDLRMIWNKPGLSLKPGETAPPLASLRLDTAAARAHLGLPHHSEVLREEANQDLAGLDIFGKS